MASPTEASRRAAWLTQGERGSSFWIEALLRFSDRFGRAATRGPLHTIAAYYALRGGETTAASRAYLQRVRGRATPAMVYRHLLTFAQCTLDRVYFLRGRADLFRVTCTGIENLRELAAARRGAILLGAHLGSFEAARIVGGWQDFPIHILVHLDNARRINAFLRAVAPDFDARLIEVDERGVGHVFRVQEAIERGELVAILGDRVGLNEKAETARFLGGWARFPTGPYVLAAALGCPVYLTFGLYRDPDRYDLHCEPFASRLELPRRSRAAALRDQVQRYAQRLEDYCRRAPYNWFNFYDFWAS